MLRHRGVFGEMGAVDRSKEENAILRKFQEPTVVEFRRGGDKGNVMKVVKESKYVEIRAAVGAGKSTVVPLMISKALGCLVIHTIPFGIAAQYLADYLVRQEIDGDKFVYMDDLHADMPTRGVVLMSNPFFHARRAYDAFAGVENAVLYLDESHESDGWTAALRTLAPAIKSFRCVVKATATAGPADQMNPDLPARREICTYRKVDVSTWSANDRNVPWSASQIRTNVMMCIDRASTRAMLADQYKEYGFTVRDCTDGDYAYFRESMRMLQDETEGIVIVLVDYKYRSSFSIPNTAVFIDSCEVAVPTVQDGAPKVVYRPAFDFEVQQFLGRGARMRGCPATLYRCDEPSRKMMCDLESLECDAANLLYRLVGFRPPLELAEYPYFRGNVPIDIAAAMASKHPLRLCPEESKVPWVNGHKAFLLEKQKAAYEYSAFEKGPRAVSCHTVFEEVRSVSPPPAVPERYRTLSVDVDGLDEYRLSRDSSPSVVFTLDTDVYDNLTAAQEASAVKPKRVAKRVLEARAAAEAVEAERRKAEAHLSGESVSPVGVTSPEVLEAQSVALASVAEKRQGVSLARQQTVVAHRGADLSGFAAVADTVRPVYAALRERDEKGGAASPGKYYHYHGMDAAPKYSTAFLRGLESIVEYCSSRDARSYVKGLPPQDKLYAMRELVDASNNSTAVAMGMQRLFKEVSSRPIEDWEAIVDRRGMLEEFEWMVGRCTEEQARVNVYHSIIPLFAKYELEEISPPLVLEQRVMVSVMERFERVAVKKDPDKMRGYWQRLNGRDTVVGPRSQAKGKHNTIQFH